MPPMAPAGARDSAAASAADPTRDAAPGAATSGELARIDAIFRGFADPTRLRILSVLAAGELCVKDIVDVLELPQPLVSRHLAQLRRAGLVTVTRDSRFAHYRLADPTGAVHANLLACVRDCFAGVPLLDRERTRAAERAAAGAGAPC